MTRRIKINARSPPKGEERRPLKQSPKDAHSQGARPARSTRGKAKVPTRHQSPMTPGTGTETKSRTPQRGALPKRKGSRTPGTGTQTKSRTMIKAKHRPTAKVATRHQSLMIPGSGADMKSRTPHRSALPKRKGSRTQGTGAETMRKRKIHKHMKDAMHSMNLALALLSKE